MTTKDVACPQCGGTQLDMVFEEEEARFVCQACGATFHMAEEDVAAGEVGDVSEDDLARMTEVLPEEMLTEADEDKS